MKILLRFYPINDGSVKFDDIDVSDIQLASLRQSISLVNQDPFLFEGTLYDNLIYGRPEASVEQVIEACKIAQDWDFVDAYPDKFAAQVGERGNKLSGGQRQRLSIARAVLKNSPILILDEATSAVDNETEAAIGKSIELIAKNSTVIIIAHRLSTVRHANCIYHLKDGQISESGTHEQLLACDRDYANLWRLQSAEQFKLTTGNGIVISQTDTANGTGDEPPQLVANETNESANMINTLSPIKH
jgi:ATP-binding cassette subfamily B protein